MQGETAIYTGPEKLLALFARVIGTILSFSRLELCSSESTRVVASSSQLCHCNYNWTQYYHISKDMVMPALDVAMGIGHWIVII